MLLRQNNFVGFLEETLLNFGDKSRISFVWIVVFSRKTLWIILN